MMFYLVILALGLFFVYTLRDAILILQQNCKRRNRHKVSKTASQKNIFQLYYNTRQGKLQESKLKIYEIFGDY